MKFYNIDETPEFEIIIGRSHIKDNSIHISNTNIHSAVNQKIESWGFYDQNIRNIDS